ncbi:hypothetical protein Emag_002464 [Eimeria magna]
MGMTSASSANRRGRPAAARWCLQPMLLLEQSFDGAQRMGQLRGRPRADRLEEAEEEKNEEDFTARDLKR